MYISKSKIHYIKVPSFHLKCYEQYETPICRLRHPIMLVVWDTCIVSDTHIRDTHVLFWDIHVKCDTPAYGLCHPPTIWYIKVETVTPNFSLRHLLTLIHLQTFSNTYIHFNKIAKACRIMFPNWDSNEADVLECHCASSETSDNPMK
jgi:hypothetical protein